MRTTWPSHAKAAENLGGMIASGILTRDPVPGL